MDQLLFQGWLLNIDLFKSVTVLAMNEKMPIHSNAIKELQQHIAVYEDQVAYKKIFFHFFLPLKYFSYTIIKSIELAEEIVSDVLIDIWARRKHLFETEDFRSFLPRYLNIKLTGKL